MVTAVNDANYMLMRPVRRARCFMLEQERLDLQNEIVSPGEQFRDTHGPRGYAVVLHVLWHCGTLVRVR